MTPSNKNFTVKIYVSGPGGVYIVTLKAFLADFWTSPLRKGITSTAAKRTKKKTMLIRFAMTTGGT